MHPAPFPVLCLFASIVAGQADAAAAEWHLTAPDDVPGTISIGALERSYYVHLPAGYDRARPLPLMMVLHGGGGTGAQMDHYSALNALADRVGCIVVFPDGGVGERDASSKPASWLAHLNAEDDDVRFIDALLDRLAADFAVDQAHVMVAGGSAGALMALRAAIELAPKLKTIGAVSGEMTWSLRDGEPPPPRTPAAPVSVIEIQGRDDKLFDGFRSPTAVGWSCERTLGWWAELDGCAEPSETVSGGVTRRIWPPGRDGAQVAMVAIDGIGHGFPQAGHGGVDSGTELWNFLTRDECCRLPRYEGFLDRLEVSIAPSPGLPVGAEIALTTDGREPTAADHAPNTFSLTASTSLRVAAFVDGKRVGTERWAEFHRLTPRPSEHPSRTEPGLRWAYIPGGWKRAAEALDTKPTSTGLCVAPDATVAPIDHHYALLFTGYLRVPADGLYTISSSSDDGSLVEIGGERVVANDGPHPAHPRGSRVALAAGLHGIRIAFFESEGDRVLELSLAEGDGAARRLGADDFVRVVE